MHELSIASSLIEIVSEAARKEGATGVRSITLRVGALSCVHNHSLEFSFEVVSKDTFVEGAELKLIDVPVSIFCVSCDQEVELPGIQLLRCPLCDTPSGDIRGGKELEIESIEILEETTAES
jgi:hydrogenase nickel incorporation protein HypA/HybF